MYIKLYILTNIFCYFTGKVHPRSLSIPLFVNIKLARAEGLQKGKMKDFYRSLSALNDTAKIYGNINRERNQGN